MQRHWHLTLADDPTTTFKTHDPERLVELAAELDRPVRITSCSDPACEPELDHNAAALAAKSLMETLPHP